MKLAVDPGEVHLWSIPLTASAPEIACARELLSVTEQERLLEVIDPARHVRLTLARAALRVILGCYLDAEPQRLALTRTAAGQPVLASPARAPAFSLSHSGELALMAVTARERVGVDIEQLTQRPALQSLLERVLTPSEATAVRALPPAGQELALLAHWTAKEAYLKALGTGWDRDPRELNVADALAADTASETFTLQRVDPNPGVVGTVAVAGGAWTAVPQTLRAGYFG